MTQRWLTLASLAFLVAISAPLLSGISAAAVTWVPAVRDEASGGTILVHATDIDWTDGTACITLQDDVEGGEEAVLCPYAYEEATLHPRHAAGRLAVSWVNGERTTQTIPFVVPHGREARLDLELSGSRLNTTVRMPDRIEATGMPDSAFRWVSGVAQMAFLAAVPVLIVIQARWSKQARCLAAAFLVWPVAATAQDPIHYLAFPWPFAAAALVAWSWFTSWDKPDNLEPRGQGKDA